MKKLTEKQKKFVKKVAIVGSGILAVYLAYKAGTKEGFEDGAKCGFEDGCIYAAGCFTTELKSGDHYKMQVLAADGSGWFDANAVDCDIIDGRMKFIGRRYERVEK